jgi:hypothetical protein
MSVTHRPGAGRGGGLRSPNVSDRLTTIEENAPILEDQVPLSKSGNAVVVTFSRDPVDSQDLSGLLAGTVPPEHDSLERQTTMFTFRAQLTWGLKKGPEVNLPALFMDWVANTAKNIPDFALVPFEDDKGQVISTPDQVPYDNPSFYKDYYHNH